METKVVNLRREQYDVYIGRAGHGQDVYFGNPIRRMPGEVPGATVARYRDYFKSRIKNDPEFKNRIEGLKGKRLGCFCKPAPCHGDVIAEYLNELK